MKMEDTRRYEMLVRVADFGAAHEDVFPADSLCGQMFAAARSAAVTLAEHAAAEISSRGAVRECVRAREVARGRLLTVLETIRRTARALALDMPGVEGKFSLPSSHGSRVLAVAAHACSLDAHALSGPLIAHGLPPTFIGDLDAAVLAFETAMRDHARSRAGLVAARAAVENGMRGALTAVQRLDAIVPNQFHDDPATSAVWEQARYVDRPSRARSGARKRPATTPETPPATSAPVEATTTSA